jgi:precorrin-3B synthase
MPTGDGLLVRFMPAGTISPAAFAGLCAAARRHGNGVIEVTARGSIQVRGLSAATAPLFADAAAVLGIAADDGVSVLTNALAGLDCEEILDGGTVAAGLRRALRHAPFVTRLAPKVSVVVDGGGLGLGDIAADVRLCAASQNGRTTLRVGVGGNGDKAIRLGTIAIGDGVETAMRLLDTIAQRGTSARARDVLTNEGPAPFCAAIAHLLLTRADQDSGTTRNDDVEPSSPIGVRPLRDGLLAYGVGLAFGHADAGGLEQFSDLAAAAGAAGLQAAAGRALMIVGVETGKLPVLIAAAEKIGFVVRSDDPRRYVVACAGAPICSSGHLAARAVAPLVADRAATRLGASFQVHISGCAKGCAHAAAAALTIVGSPEGCDLVADGTARDAPFATVKAGELAAAVARYARQTVRERSHV